VKLSKKAVRVALSFVTISAGLVAASTMVNSTATAASTPSAVVDDATTSGANHFAFSGSWVKCGGCNAGAYKNSFRYSSTTGNTATLTFTGTQAVLYGYKEQWGGIAGISVDGGPSTDLNLYSPTQSLTAFYTSPSLTAGTHTIRMIVTGRGTGSSRTINIDKADVFTGTTPAATTSTTSTSGSTSTSTSAPVSSSSSSSSSSSTTSTTTTTITSSTTSSTTTSSTTTPPSTGGIASLSFDDDQIGQYNYAVPAMVTAGVNGTFYVISDAMGWGSTNMNGSQLKTVAGHGNEIGNHTRDHSDLASLSAAKVQAEFADSQNAIRNATGITPTTCAYPFGSSNASVRTIAAAAGLKACRGTDSGTNARGALAPFNLLVHYVQTKDSYAQIKTLASASKASNTWLILVYHGVGKVGSSDDVTADTFIQHVQALKDAGISVQTVSQAYDTMSH
jgi:peptidoglycan/xylan/chitin deacetylase (PgdA/CDA1 family)